MFGEAFPGIEIDCGFVASKREVSLMCPDVNHVDFWLMRPDFSGRYQARCLFPNPIGRVNEESVCVDLHAFQVYRYLNWYSVSPKLHQAFVIRLVGLIFAFTILSVTIVSPSSLPNVVVTGSFFVKLAWLVS